MSNLTKFSGGLPANPEVLEQGLQNMAQSIEGASGGIALLRLQKSGVFVYGPENIEVEEGSHWAVNPYTMMHGFACWGDGELLDERMVPMTSPPPPQAELPDYGQPWNQQVSMMMQCVSGEDEGQPVLYKGTSLGLRNAVKELIQAVVAQLSVDKKNCVPVITLESDSYIHKKHGETFFPVLEVEKFISMDGLEEAEPADDEDEGEEEVAEEKAAAPARGRRSRKSKTVNETEDEPEKPARRRRRRRG